MWRSGCEGSVWCVEEWVWGSVRGVWETVGSVEERERLWGVWRGGCRGV